MTARCCPMPTGSFRPMTARWFCFRWRAAPSGSTPQLGARGPQLLRALFEAEDERYRWLNNTLCGIDGVEPKPIGELHHGGNRRSVITCRRDGDTSRRTLRTPAFVELVVGNVIEALHHPRRREALLDDDARAGWRRGEFLIDAVDFFPIVHRIDEDLAGEEVAWQLPEAVHRHGQDDEVRMTYDLVGRDGASAGRQHLDDQRDAIGSSRPRYGDVVPNRDCCTGDRRAHPARADDAQAPLVGLTARHGVEPSLPRGGNWAKSGVPHDRPAARAPAESPR